MTVADVRWPDPGYAQAYLDSYPTFRELVAQGCLDQVPADIPAGLHLCYGDLGHSHFMQPPSLARQCQLLDAVAAAARRPVSFASFTVSQNQTDPAYFAPLAELRTGPPTQLYFSLVPYYPARQEPGTTGKQVALIDAGLAATQAGPRPWG